MSDDTRNHADKGVRLREIRRKRRRIFRIVLGAVALVVLGVLSWHTHASAQRIKTVHVSGAYLSNPIEVQRIAEEVLDGSTAYIFSNRYPWLVPISRVRKAVEAMPSVERVEIRIAEGEQLDVKLIERTPVAIACMKSECSLIDEQGTSIGTIDKATTTLIRIETDALANEDQDQPKLIDSKRTHSIITLIEALNTMGLSYNFATIIDQDQCLLTGTSVPALKAAFKTMEGAPLRMQSAIDAGALITDAKMVSYIDARFEQQVSYMPLTVMPVQELAPEYEDNAIIAE
jgi:cell division septal protein FtsQ